MHVIIIAPNREEGELISFALRRAGWGVVVSLQWEQVLSTLPERSFDLIVLVIPLSEKAVRLVEKFRILVQTPMILLVESLTEDVHCELLDAGADFILTRPYSMRLLARYARVLLKRGAAMPSSMLTVLDFGDIRLDSMTRLAVVAGNTVRLTQLEFRLLYVLMSDAGNIIPIDEIVERVWGYSGEGNRDLVRGLVRRLRRKIEPTKESSKYIQNVPGIGYCFVRVQG